MTIECRKAGWLDGEEREQSSKSSSSPMDTVLVRVFKLGWLQTCKQRIRLQSDVPPELLSIKLCSQRKRS